MSRHEFPATAPEAEQVEATLRAFSLPHDLSRDVKASIEKGVTVDVPLLVVEAMVVLLDRARPERPALIASIAGETTGAMYNALSRFVEGPGCRFIEEHEGRFALTRLGKHQAHRYVHAAAERLQRRTAPATGSATGTGVL